MARIKKDADAPERKTYYLNEIFARKKMALLHLSGKELAENIKVKHQSVSNYLNGKSNIPYKRLVLLSTFFKCELEELVKK